MSNTEPVPAVEPKNESQQQEQENEQLSKTAVGTAEENKHLLENTWCLWFDNPKKKPTNETWEENLKKIFTFNTIEDYWCLMNNIQIPSKLVAGSNYHMFKEGIRPMWEDPINLKGGKWVYSSYRTKRAKLDESWLNTTMAIIGEVMEDEDDICGAVVSVRKNQDRISVWTKTAANEDLQKAIGKKFRTVLDLPRQSKLNYMAHADSAASGSSFVNEVHYEA